MATQEGVTRISAQQQKQAGFSDPREFSEALTQMENQARGMARQGRSILQGEGTAPTFDVAELETDTTEMVTPEPDTTGRDQARDIIQSATASAQQALTEREQQQLDRSDEVQEGQQEQNRLLSSLAESFGLQAQRGKFTQQAEEEAGIGEKSEEVTEIQNKILTKERDFQNRLRTIQEDQTLSAAQKDARIADVESKQARELADLSIIEQTRLNDFNTAQALVNRKVELEFADRKAVLDAQKFFYQENKEALTKEEDRQFQRLIKKEDRAYEQAFARQERNEQAKLQVMEQASTYGAPNEVLQNIQQAETAEEAFEAGQGFLRDPLEVELMREKILNARWERSNKSIELAKEQQDEEQEAVAASDKALNIQRQVNDILNHPALGAATGPIGSWVPTPKTFGIDITSPTTGFMGKSTTDFEASFDQLKNSLTLDNLKLMSGVLSESDIQILASAASRLRVDMTEGEFKNELKFIRQKMQRTVDKNGVTEEQLQFYGGYDQSDISEINSIYGEETGDSTTEAFNPQSFY